MVLLGVCFIKFNNVSSIVVKAPLYDVARQVNDFNNWKKWDTIFKTGSSVTGGFSSNQTTVTTNGTYILHHLSPVAFSLTKNSKGSRATTFITIAPLTDSATIITSEEKRTVLNYIVQGSSHGTGAGIIANFKAWMENADNKYGYPIQLVPVKDTLILTVKEAFDSPHINVVTGKLYNLLHSFIQQHNLPFEKGYFYKTVLSDKEIAVGIPVYKQVKDTGNINCLQLPRNGRLVQGRYTGNIANIASIYTAITNFMLDKHLKQVAQPLEQYNVADTAAAAGNNVTVNIFYPIF